MLADSEGPAQIDQYLVEVAFVTGAVRDEVHVWLTNVVLTVMHFRDCERSGSVNQDVTFHLHSEADRVVSGLQIDRGGRRI